MAEVAILKKNYLDEETGRNIPYERLAIIGTISGQPYTLEIKLTAAELLSAKMLLASKENLHVESGSAKGETIEVKRKKKSDDDDLADLLG